MLAGMSHGPAGFEEYTDPRLVALYDSGDPDRVDVLFYFHLATQLRWSRLRTSAAAAGCSASSWADATTRQRPGHRPGTMS